ncbi:PREDICTED: ribosome-binding protein 1-like [Nicotiana attenuata]|uniref:ribosome-binding protein 1-like n=1 Tax=Nicotiana attenuata TaxID=49451 RepID=UPI0009058C4F|nr:PREDICTED: ribosome-binding protein 1-like [Nicotiana attenuata]
MQTRKERRGEGRGGRQGRAKKHWATKRASPAAMATSEHTEWTQRGRGRGTGATRGAERQEGTGPRDKEAKSAAEQAAEEAPDNQERDKRIGGRRPEPRGEAPKTNATNGARRGHVRPGQRAHDRETAPAGRGRRRAGDGGAHEEERSQRKRGAGRTEAKRRPRRSPTQETTARGHRPPGPGSNKGEGTEAVLRPAGTRKGRGLGGGADEGAKGGEAGAARPKTPNKRRQRPAVGKAKQQRPAAAPKESSWRQRTARQRSQKTREGGDKGPEQARDSHARAPRPPTGQAEDGKENKTEDERRNARKSQRGGPGARRPGGGGRPEPAQAATWETRDARGDGPTTTGHEPGECVGEPKPVKGGTDQRSRERRVNRLQDRDEAEGKKRNGPRRMGRRNNKAKRYDNKRKQRRTHRKGGTIGRNSQNKGSKKNPSRRKTGATER